MGYDSAEAIEMIKGYLAAILCAALIALFFYLTGPLKSATMAPPVDYSVEAQEEIDKVDKEIADRARQVRKSPYYKRGDHGWW
jgi:hypothetical protein